MTAEERFDRIAARHLAEAGVSEGTGFGANAGLRVGGKIFAMLVHGRLVVKLPAKRVEALVDERAGRRFDPGHGRIQREWLDVSSDDFETWVALASESEAFVARRKA